MKLFISPDQETDWKIDIVDLKTQLNEKWSSIKIHEVTNPNRRYCLEWELLDNGKVILEGRLNNDCNTIVIESQDAEKIYTLICWYRNIIPLCEEIRIYDENYDFSLDIKRLTFDKLIAVL